MQGPDSPPLSSVLCHPLTAFSPPRPAPSCPLPNSEKLTGIKLEVEEIALTTMSQRRKLEAVLEATNRSLQLDEQQVKWSVDSTWGLSPGWCPGQGWGSLGPFVPGVASRLPRGMAQPPQVWAQAGDMEGGRSLRQAQRNTDACTQTALGISVPRGCHCSKAENKDGKCRLVNTSCYLLSSKYHDEPSYLV